MDEAACLVKDMIDSVSGRHLAFVCTSCTTPFLPPSLATKDWLACVATMNEADQSAHRVGASLLKSKNKSFGPAHPTGVPLAQCNRCYLRGCSRGRASREELHDCRSVRHTSGTPTPGRYAPSPGILPWL